MVLVSNIFFNCNASSLVSAGKFRFELTKGYLVRGVKVNGVRAVLSNTNWDQSGADVPFVAIMKSGLDTAGGTNGFTNSTTNYFAGIGTLVDGGTPAVPETFAHMFPLIDGLQQEGQSISTGEVCYDIIQNGDGTDQFGPFLEFEVGYLKLTTSTGTPHTKAVIALDTGDLDFTNMGLQINPCMIEISVELDFVAGEVWEE